MGENPQLIRLTGLHIMLAQWWRWSVQATAQTTGQPRFKFSSMCKPLEWIRSLTKIRTATYAKTYPGAVYTAIEVGIIFCKEFQNYNQIIKGDYPPTLCERQARPSRHRPGECGWVHPSMVTGTWFLYWYSFLRLASRFCKWLAGCFAFGKVTLWYLSPFQIKLDRDIRFLKKKVQPICLPSKILAQAGYNLT